MSEPGRKTLVDGPPVRGMQHEPQSRTPSPDPGSPGRLPRAPAAECGISRLERRRAVAFSDELAVRHGATVLVAAIDEWL
ncbi:hypothetical protein [Streptomyces sp. WMMC940]|uniref:hypothetical protein n=1 Tax=Streptomyces sp. WMMC940 TaxID=3015153 RepID=UPI0022B6C020|nr:hypothetical protein [Streptomyces sp. WMMC940]MCZ7462241.1 hypothetical protein [Streptomyces sp. WMMC940]